MDKTFLVEEASADVARERNSINDNVEIKTEQLEQIKAIDEGYTAMEGNSKESVKLHLSVIESTEAKDDKHILEKSPYDESENRQTSMLVEDETETDIYTGGLHASLSPKDIQSEENVFKIKSPEISYEETNKEVMSSKHEKSHNLLVNQISQDNHIGIADPINFEKESPNHQEYFHIPQIVIQIVEEIYSRETIVSKQISQVTIPQETSQEQKSENKITILPYMEENLTKTEESHNKNLQNDIKNLNKTNRAEDFALNFQQNNTTEQLLPTGSRYQGVWQKALQCPDGYGTYTYPDGSEYRGYFSRGHFNGYGTLHLADPYNFNFKGTFLDGLLDEIEDMWFDDGLHVNAKFGKESGDFSFWKYCCPNDRRYAVEQAESLPPVGPYSILTPREPFRNVPENCFDTEEGLYNPTTGVITQRPLPFNAMKVLACKDEIRWILENCRKTSVFPQDIPGTVCQKIIKNNLESERDLAEHDPCCNYESARERKRYFAKLCSKEETQARIGTPCNGKVVEFSEDSMGSRLRDSSSVCGASSLSDHNILIDVQENLEIGRQYGNMKLGRNLEREAYSLMSRPVRKSSAHNSKAR
ncbi:uncharacterized protein [Musca autumnalis]|uniref:uncharacterized protein n=1 Tax=Musca autumnalis TaxID=221902 RepID=UPI003CEFE312